MAFLVVGPPGVGKSTLINSLVGEDVAKHGVDASGVTDAITTYKRSASPPLELMDTPGWGGPKGMAVELCHKLGEHLKDHEIRGILLCVDMLNIRLEMANQFLLMLVDKFIPGPKKWDHVIVVLTKANLAAMVGQPTKEMALTSVRASMQKQVPEFKAEQIIFASKGEKECSNLIQMVESMMSMSNMPKPEANPDKQLFFRLCEVVLGLTPDIVRAILQKSGACFAYDSTVQLASGQAVRLRDLKHGDMVRDQDGWTRFVGFFHLADSVPVKFILLDVGKFSVKMTPAHMVMVETGSGFVAMPAGAVRRGSVLMCSDGVARQVLFTTVAQMDGFLAPLTVSGTLFVDGILCSCYADFLGISYFYMHMAMLPARALFHGGLAPPDRNGSLHWYPAALKGLAASFTL